MYIMLKMNEVKLEIIKVYKYSVPQNFTCNVKTYIRRIIEI
jgi:hypothetical protein